MFTVKSVPKSSTKKDIKTKDAKTKPTKETVKTPKDKLKEQKSKDKLKESKSKTPSKTPNLSKMSGTELRTFKLEVWRKCCQANGYLCPGTDQKPFQLCPKKGTKEYDSINDEYNQQLAKYGINPEPKKI